MECIQCCPYDPSVIMVCGNGFLRQFRVLEGALKPIVVNLKREPQFFHSMVWIDEERFIVGCGSGEIMLFESNEFKAVLPSSPTDGTAIRHLLTYEKVCIRVTSLPNPPPADRHRLSSLFNTTGCTTPELLHAVTCPFIHNANRVLRVLRWPTQGFIAGGNHGVVMLFDIQEEAREMYKLSKRFAVRASVRTGWMRSTDDGRACQTGVGCR